MLTAERLKWLVANKRLEMVHGGNPFVDDDDDPFKKALERLDKGRATARKSKAEAEQRKKEEKNNSKGYSK